MTGGNSAVAALRRPLAAALLRLPGAESRALAATAARTRPRRRRPPPSSPGSRRHDCARNRSSGSRRRRRAGSTTCSVPDIVLLYGDVVDSAELRSRARAVGARRVRLGRPDPGADDDADITIPSTPPWPAGCAGAGPRGAASPRPRGRGQHAQPKQGSRRQRAWSRSQAGVHGAPPATSAAARSVTGGPAAGSRPPWSSRKGGYTSVISAT